MIGLIIQKKKKKSDNKRLECDNEKVKREFRDLPYTPSEAEEEEANQSNRGRRIKNINSKQNINQTSCIISTIKSWK